MNLPLDQIQALMPKAREAFAGLSTDQILRRPAPGTWCVGECIEHLNTTNRKYLAAMQEQIEAARHNDLRGSGPFRLSLFERLFVTLLEPPYRIRFKTPGAFVPPAEIDPEQVLREWDTTHARLVDVARETDGLHLTRIRIPSPAGGPLKPSLFATFHIIAAHDRRHLWQAARIREKL